MDEFVASYKRNASRGSEDELFVSGDLVGVFLTVFVVDFVSLPLSLSLAVALLLSSFDWLTGGGEEDVESMVSPAFRKGRLGSSNSPILVNISHRRLVNDGGSKPTIVSSSNVMGCKAETPASTRSNFSSVGSQALSKRNRKSMRFNLVSEKYYERQKRQTEKSSIEDTLLTTGKYRRLHR